MPPAISSATCVLRFTHRDGALNAVLLDLSANEFGLWGLDATDVTEVRLLGLGQPVQWWVTDAMLHVRLPDRIPASPAYVLSLGHGARPA